MREDTPESVADRRRFLKLLGVGSAAGLLAACSKPEAPPPRTGPVGPGGGGASQSKAPPPPTTDGDLGALSSLPDGKGTTYTFHGEPVIVVREGEQVTAHSAKCTHKGCLVTWQGEQKQFFCPCHKSLFGPDGAVIHGPAKEPLPAVPVTVSDGKVKLT